MEIVTTVIPVTTTGSAGAATGTATSSALVPGWLIDIYLDFNATAPATTDVTISYAARGGNLLTAANSGTDALLTPRAKPVDNAGAAISNAHDRFLINDRVTVAVAECDALAPAVTVYIRSLRF